MESHYRPTWAEISLDAIRHNIHMFRNTLGNGVQLMAVVKANAYGHGAEYVAREALACGADYLAVAFLDEALQLRQAGIQAPILVLGYTGPEGLVVASRHNITLNVYSEEVLQTIEQLAQQGQLPNGLNIHIKIDTGMGRIGLFGEENAIAFIERASKTPALHIEGLFTHYAKADERDKTYTQEQYRRFNAILHYFAAKGIHFPYAHAGNSAAGIDCTDLTCGMTRLGISMYGYYPSKEVNRERVHLQPVFSLKTKIVYCKQVPKGMGISYGTIYQTSRVEKIATLPIGYADGVSRKLSGQAHVLVRGYKVPIVGRICMDQCMIDVTDVPDVAVGDEVVMIGKQGEEQITAEDWADMLDTIPYEITCMISQRVPRIYIDGGQQVEITNPLLKKSL